MDELTIKGPCKAHPSVTSPFSPRSEKGSALNDIRGKAQIELTTVESLYLISFSHFGVRYLPDRWLPHMSLSIIASSISHHIKP